MHRDLVCVSFPALSVEAELVEDLVPDKVIPLPSFLIVSAD